MAQIDTAALDALGSGAHRFAGPVLLMAGACSHWIGPDHQRGHMKLFSDAELAVIAGAGHDVVDDAPEAAVARIRAFRSRTAAQPSGT
jgi:proline iminopeptidase